MRSNLRHISMHSGCNWAIIASGNRTSVDFIMFWSNWYSAKKYENILELNHKKIQKLSITSQVAKHVMQSQNIIHQRTHIPHSTKKKMTWTWLFPLKGGRPVTNWKRIAPTLHRSACKDLRSKTTEWTATLCWLSYSYLNWTYLTRAQ